MDSNASGKQVAIVKDKQCPSAVATILSQEHCCCVRTSSATPFDVMLPVRGSTASLRFHVADFSGTVQMPTAQELHKRCSGKSAQGATVFVVFIVGPKHHKPAFTAMKSLQVAMDRSSPLKLLLFPNYRDACRHMVRSAQTHQQRTTAARVLAQIRPKSRSEREEQARRRCEAALMAIPDADLSLEEARFLLGEYGSLKDLVLSVDKHTLIRRGFPSLKASAVA